MDIMKNLVWLLLLPFGLFLEPTSLEAAKAESPRIEAIDDSRFAVKFKSRRYDPETQRTRFRYRVNPEGRSEPIRFVIGYGACGNVEVELDAEPHERVSTIRTNYLDAATGIYGVEWASRLRRWRGTPFWFEIVGDIPLGSVRIAVEEGEEIVAGLLPGPTCSPLGRPMSGR